MRKLAPVAARRRAAVLTWQNDSGRSAAPNLGALGLFLLLMGCGPRPYLTWSPGPYSEAQAPRLQLVQLIDDRPDDRGGGRENVVHAGRREYGEPIWLNLNGPGSKYLPFPFLETMRQLLERALVEANPTDTASRSLSIDLTDFWCDGYMLGYSADISMEVLVLDPSGQNVLSRIPEQVSAHAGDCNRAYSRALTRLHKRLVEAFRTQPH